MLYPKKGSGNKMVVVNPTKKLPTKALYKFVLFLSIKEEPSLLVALDKERIIGNDESSYS